ADAADHERADGRALFPRSGREARAGFDAAAAEARVDRPIVLALGQDDLLLERLVALGLEAEGVHARIERDGAAVELLGDELAVGADFDRDEVLAGLVFRVKDDARRSLLDGAHLIGAVLFDRRGADVARAREELLARLDELAVVAERLRLFRSGDAVGFFVGSRDARSREDCGAQRETEGRVHMHSRFQILWPLSSRVYGGSQFFGGAVAVGGGGAV